MDWVNGFNGLDFNKQSFVDQQIESEFFFALKLLVPNNHIVLVLDRMVSQTEFHRQAPFVNQFKQSRPFILVHFNRSPDYLNESFQRLVETEDAS